MIITTPINKAVVTLKDSLTFGQERELQKVLLNEIEITPDQAVKGDFKIPASFIQKSEEKAFEFLVEKIVIGEETITTDLYNVVMGWTSADGKAVMDAINKITSPAKTTEEKKS